MRFISIGSSPVMRFGILSGLSKLKHDTGHFPHHGWLSLGEDEGCGLLERYIEEYKPDYLIFGGYAPKYFSKIPEICRKRGTAFLYWALEDPIGFDNTLFLARIADYVFTTTEECISEYKKHGINAHLLLSACNPDYNKIGKYCPDLDIDLALTASYYRWEARIRGYKIVLDAAKESGRSLKVWGAGWQGKAGQDILGNPDYFQGYLANSKIPDLCASAKIILGVQCVDESTTQTSMRPYEVLGCRGFHLTQWTKAIESIFEDGKHLVIARTKEDALEKIKYYLDHPAERMRIAKQGQAFVYKHHTFEQRVRDMVIPHL